MLYGTTLVVLALRCKSRTDQISSILDNSFPILASVLRKPRKRVTAQVPPLRPLQCEEDHGGQERSHGQHLVIDSVPNADLGSTSKFSKRPSAIFLPRLGRRRSKPSHPSLPQAVISYDLLACAAPADIDGPPGVVTQACCFNPTLIPSRYSRRLRPHFLETT
jgi:hypothetical protein